MSEVIAAARSEREEMLIEQALDAASIAYSFSLGGDDEAEEGAVCFLARVYAVPESDAARARDALRQKGLAANVRGTQVR